MKPLLIVQNITREGPGLLEEILREEGVEHDLADLGRGAPFPMIGKYGAVVVLGGPDSANDTTPKMLDEISRIREILKSGTPYLGICLGLQTLVKAAGGEVFKNAVPEIGFRDPKNQFFEIVLTEDGKRDPLFDGLPEKLRVFQLHGETVGLKPGMKLLGSGEYCRNQIVKAAERAYGFQCHFELTRKLLEVWAEQDADLKKKDKEGLLEDYTNLAVSYRENAKKIFKNFLKISLSHRERAG